MIIRELNEFDLEDCISLFIEVYNQQPWNNEWTYETAKELFNEFSSTKGCIGYVAIDATKENEIMSVLIGKQKTWWRGKEYVIEEFFVRPEYQGKGIGTKVLEFIAKDLKKYGVGNITLLTNTYSEAYPFYLNKDFNENKTLRLLYKNI